MSLDDSPQGAGTRRRYPLAKMKGGWTPQEDTELKRLVEEHGEGNWSVIARHLNAALGKPADSGRIGKQCRERYNHHLRPDIKKDAWTDEEEQLLVAAHLRYGNRWSDIARHIRGRTENSVKNHWNATLRRKDSDKGGARGVQQHQSCVLRDYMVRIALLTGPEHAALPRPTALEPIALPPLAPLPPVAPTEAAQPASRAAEGSPAAAAQGSAEAGSGSGSGGEHPVPAAAAAAQSPSPCSSTSTHAGLAASDGGQRCVETPADPVTTDATAAAGQAAALASAAPVPIAAAAAAPDAAAPLTAPSRKRPRIITFAAAPPPSGSRKAQRAAHVPSEPASEAGLGALPQAQLLQAHCPLLQQPSAQGGAQRRQRAQRGAAAMQGWASDSTAEESMYGSPVSERFQPYDAYDDSLDAADEQAYGNGRRPHTYKQQEQQQVEADELEGSTEVQAAQIMLALRSLVGAA